MTRSRYSYHYRVVPGWFWLVGWLSLNVNRSFGRSLGRDNLLKWVTSDVRVDVK